MNSTSTRSAPPVHGSVAEVNFDAIAHNVRDVRTAAAPGDIVAVVKANAYGHGLEVAVEGLQRAGVTRYAVATVDEGCRLREQGVLGQIILLGGATWFRDPQVLWDFKLTPVISSDTEVARLMEFCEAENGFAPLPVHLALDTGMTREGVPLHQEQSPDMMAIASAIDRSSGLRLEGVMSHFANADLASTALTHQQLHLFLEMAISLVSKFSDLKELHIDNSAALLSALKAEHHLQRLFERRSDLTVLARPGISLYGVSPFPNQAHQQRLKPVLTWKAPIVVRKRVPPRTPVSYGSTVITQRTTEIAVLGAGYADGYARAASGRGYVLCAGRRAPILGRVCMDLMVVDLTDIVAEFGPESCGVGEDVVLLGEQAGESIDAWELAQWSGTIAYECLTSIGERVHRVAT